MRLFGKSRTFWYDEFCKVSDENVKLVRQLQTVEYENYYLQACLRGGTFNVMGYCMSVKDVPQERFNWIMTEPDRSAVGEWCRTNNIYYKKEVK